jgi:hypothetical protein
VPNSSGAARLRQWSQVQPSLDLGTVLAAEQAAYGLCHDHFAGRAVVESKEACREHLRNAQGAEGIIHPGHVMTAQPGRDDL